MRVQQKFGYWTEIPYRLVALYGCILGVVPQGGAKDIAKEVVQSLKDIQAKGLSHRLHRVAKRFFNGILWEELEIFATGPEPLECFSSLAVALFPYAFGSIVCRRIEGVHSQVHNYKKKKTCVRVARLSAQLRRREAESLIEDAAFLDWAAQSWSKRLFLHKALLVASPSASPASIWRLPLLEVVKRWYQYDLDTQFAPLSERREAVREWQALAGPLQRPPALPFAHTGDDELSKYLKSKLSETGVVWSLPRQRFFPQGEVRGSGFQKLELFDQVCKLAAEVAEPGALPTSLEGDLIFFRVVSAFPERMHVVNIPHAEKAASQIVVSMSKCLHIDLDLRQAAISEHEAVQAPFVSVRSSGVKSTLRFAWGKFPLVGISLVVRATRSALRFRLPPTPIQTPHPTPEGVGGLAGLVQPRHVEGVVEVVGQLDIHPLGLVCASEVQASGLAAHVRADGHATGRA